MSTATGRPGLPGHSPVLTTDEAERLWRTTDIVELGARADEARRQRHGDRVTFVRVAMRALKDPGEAVWPSSAGEVRVVGNPADVGQAERAVAAVVRLAGSTPVSAFSLGDLRAIASTDDDFAELLARLFGAGLTAIAEAETDRHEDLRRLIEMVLAVEGRVARFTVAGGVGNPVALCAAVRALQKATGAVRAFAPLPRAVDASVSTTGYDDVKTVAIARLLLDNVDAIQVDWCLHGPKLAQVALLFGADDIDAVSPDDEVAEGRRRAPLEEVRRNIRAASLTPVERDGRFGVRER